MKNWKKKAMEYIIARNFQEGSYPEDFKTQEKARSWIESEINFIIATNGGESWLWDMERNLLKEISEETKLIINKKMKTYLVHTVSDCFTTYRVEAESEAEAIEKQENGDGEMIGEDFANESIVEVNEEKQVSTMTLEELKTLEKDQKVVKDYLRENGVKNPFNN